MLHPKKNSELIQLEINNIKTNGPICTCTMCEFIVKNK